MALFHRERDTWIRLVEMWMCASAVKKQVIVCKFLKGKRRLHSHLFWWLRRGGLNTSWVGWLSTHSLAFFLCLHHKQFVVLQLWETIEASGSSWTWTLINNGCLRQLAQSWKFERRNQLLCMMWNCLPGLSHSCNVRLSCWYSLNQRRRRCVWNPVFGCARGIVTWNTGCFIKWNFSPIRNHFHLATAKGSLNSLAYLLLSIVE